MRPTETRQTPPTPIWLAALVATGCQAVTDRDRHDVGWRWSRDHALYTNVSTGPERIDPLGVTLAGGETLSVTWIPGETAYTLFIDCGAGNPARSRLSSRLDPLESGFAA